MTCHLKGEAISMSIVALEPNRAGSQAASRPGLCAEAILARVEAGLPVESRQVAALATLVQLSERIAVMARAEVNKQVVKGDEELAATLEKIDNRIVYLATAHARTILRKRCGMTEAEIDAVIPAVEEC